MSTSASLAPVEGLLLDLDGVVHIRDRPAPGSFEAVARLRAAKSRSASSPTPRAARVEKIIEGLAALGLAVAEDELFTPASLIRDLLARRGLAPLLVIHPDLREDFAGIGEAQAPW